MGDEWVVGCDVGNGVDFSRVSLGIYWLGVERRVRVSVIDNDYQ